MTLTRTRRSSRRSPGGPFGGTLRAWAPPAALRPSGPRRRRRASLSPRPAAPAQRRNDQRQARELQERAILPALQCEAGQDHPQGRFASHVMAYGHPCALIFPGSDRRLSEGWSGLVARHPKEFSPDAEHQTLFTLYRQRTGPRIHTSSAA